MSRYYSKAHKTECVVMQVSLGDEYELSYSSPLKKNNPFGVLRCNKERLEKEIAINKAIGFLPVTEKEFEFIL